MPFSGAAGQVTTNVCTGESRRNGAFSSPSLPITDMGGGGSAGGKDADVVVKDTRDRRRR